MITIQMLNALTANSLASLQGAVTTPPARSVPARGLAGGVQVEAVGVFRRDDAGHLSFEDYRGGRWCRLDPVNGVWCGGEPAARGVPAAYAYADDAGRTYAQTAHGWMMFDPVAGWMRVG